jgi:hypothetical protein
MTKSKRKPRFLKRGGAVQFFDYGPLRFNINKAMALAADHGKYPIRMQRPTPDWIGPGIEIDSRYVNAADLTKPVIFAILVQNGQQWSVLIDGNHRVARALQEQASLPIVTLDLVDTLKVMTGQVPMIQQMKREGIQLGLIFEEAVK